jgi:large subunit ribosomal protein L23
MKDYTDIIIAPVITEKSAIQAEGNVYTFKVASNANKIAIKNAIEAAYGVKVVNVNTLNTKSKKRRVGRYTGKTQTYKKAFIRLADGDKIEL